MSRERLNLSISLINVSSRGIRSSMDPRCLDEDVQLGDELNPQHGQLLVEDVPGF